MDYLAMALMAAAATILLRGSMESEAPARLLSGAAVAMALGFGVLGQAERREEAAKFRATERRAAAMVDGVEAAAFQLHVVEANR